MPPPCPQQCCCRAGMLCKAPHRAGNFLFSQNLAAAAPGTEQAAAVLCNTRQGRAADDLRRHANPGCILPCVRPLHPHMDGTAPGPSPPHPQEMCPELGLTRAIAGSHCCHALYRAAAQLFAPGTPAGILPRAEQLHRGSASPTLHSARGWQDLFRCFSVIL